MIYHVKNIGNHGVGRRVASALVWVVCLAGCSPRDIVGDVPLPPELRDPTATQTPAGALQAYNGVLGQFRSAFGERDRGYVEIAGLLSDELESPDVGDPELYGVFAVVDARTLPDGAVDPDDNAALLYAHLHGVRGQARQATGLLDNFAPGTSPALRGHLYALQGYSEVMLAELFCSGIPLSTVDYGGDYTLAPGSSTAEVYQHAVALFDTALALSSDSARFLNLARVGKGRALLGLGRFADAAAAVHDVPDGFRYEVSYSSMASASAANFLSAPHSVQFTISDAEGVNGLRYRWSVDPRVGADSVGVDGQAHTIYYPTKYSADGAGPIVLADWIEARLIEAEALLQAHDASSWMARLNHLRETAIAPALADTVDPGDWDAEVDLQFHERAFWLFLTGHRQGDLRRLIRQYGRFSERVYPTGSYNGHSSYGIDVNVPVPVREREANPLFRGCIGRGA